MQQSYFVLNTSVNGVDTELPFALTHAKGQLTIGRIGFNPVFRTTRAGTCYVKVSHECRIIGVAEESSAVNALDRFGTLSHTELCEIVGKDNVLEDNFIQLFADSSAYWRKAVAYNTESRTFNFCLTKVLKTDSDKPQVIVFSIQFDGLYELAKHMQEYDSLDDLSESVNRILPDVKPVNSLKKALTF